jgi:hypothetical protein
MVCLKIEELFNDGPHRIRIWSPIDDGDEIHPFGIYEISESENSRYSVSVSITPVDDPEYFPYWNSDTNMLSLRNDSFLALDFEFVDSIKVDERIEIEKELFRQCIELTEKNEDEDEEESDSDDESEDESDNESDDDDDDESDDESIVDSLESITDPEPSPEARRKIVSLIPQLFGDAIGARITVVEDDVPVGVGFLIDFDGILSGYITWNGKRARADSRGSTIPLYYDWEDSTFKFSNPLDEEYTEDIDFYFENQKYELLRTANENIARAIISHDSNDDPTHYIERARYARESYALSNRRSERDVINAADARVMLECIGAMYMVILMLYCMSVVETRSNRND